MISQLQLFAGISPEALQLLAQVAHPVVYQPGQVIMVEEDREAPVCFVHEGAVRVFRNNADGREQTIIHLRVDDVLNMPAAFANNHNSPASAIALGHVRLIEISQPDFRRVVTENAEIALVVLRDLSDKLRYFVDLTHDLSLRSVRARLARFLLRQADPHCQLRRQTHEELATQIGTAREVVSRTMHAFVTEGLVEVHSRSIIILNPPALKREAGLM